MCRNRPFLLAHPFVGCLTLRGHYNSLWGSPFVGGMAGWSPTNNIPEPHKTLVGQVHVSPQAESPVLILQTGSCFPGSERSFTGLKAMGTKLWSCVQSPLALSSSVLEQRNHRNHSNLGDNQASELQACGPIFVSFNLGHQLYNKNSPGATRVETLKQTLT